MRRFCVDDLAPTSIRRRLECDWPLWWTSSWSPFWRVGSYVYSDDPSWLTDDALTLLGVYLFVVTGRLVYLWFARPDQRCGDLVVAPVWGVVAVACGVVVVLYVNLVVALFPILVEVIAEVLVYVVCVMGLGHLLGKAFVFVLQACEVPCRVFIASRNCEEDDQKIVPDV